MSVLFPFVLFVFLVSGVEGTVAPTICPTLLPTGAPSNFATSNYKIRTIAGLGSVSTTSGTGGKATAAGFPGLFSIHQDSTGVMYAADYSAYCVRSFNPLTDSIVYSFAGVCGSTGDTSTGKATSALLSSMMGIGGDTDGNVYIPDRSNHKVKKINTSGIMTLFAGTGATTGISSSTPATSAPMGGCFDIYFTSGGTAYVSSNTLYRVYQISTSNVATVFAGASTGNTFAGDGGMATSAKFGIIYGVSGDSTGVIYISDGSNQRVRTVSTSNIVTTVAGSGSSTFTTNNVAATSAGFSLIAAVPDVSGNLYISDMGCRALIVTTNSIITTIAGTGFNSFSGDGGSATLATIKTPRDIFVNTAGSLYITEFSGSGRIREVYYVQPTDAPTRMPTTIAPSRIPSVVPTESPTFSIAPSVDPSAAPFVIPTVVPTESPTISIAPTVEPTAAPTPLPTLYSSPSYTVSNAYAFAGLTSEGSVLCWGKATSGGDCSAVKDSLSGVSEIVAGRDAFVAVTSGGVVAWGNAESIAGWDEYQYTPVEMVVATERAFAAVTKDSSVIAFGADCCGGNVDQYGWAQYLTEGVVSVQASSAAFAALKDDGSVYCWGNKFAGGGVASLTRADLSDIVQLSSTSSAFAGMTSGGNVIAWGSTQFGGSLPSSVSTATTGVTALVLSNSMMFTACTRAPTLTLGHNVVSWGDGEYNLAMGSAVKHVAHTATAFAAIRSNGSVVSWGDTEYGGGLSLSENITHVVGSQGAFAALSDSGNVTVWGHSEYGGTTSFNGTWQLENISTVVATNRAFAALNTTGSVVAWGAASVGGYISADISSNLTSGVKMLCANELAFTAIKGDGSAFMWGFSKAVTGNGILTGNYSAIVSC